MRLEKQQSSLEAYEFREKVDTSTLERFLKTELVYDDDEEGWMDAQYRCSERKHLQKLLNKIRGGVLIVKYKKKSIGRVQPMKHLAAISIRKKVRCLIYRGYLDFDMKNCHPVMLVQVCEDNGICCEALKFYVENREACLLQVQALLLNGDRDTAKNCFIIVLFGGSPRKWLREHKHKPNAELPPCVTNLVKEVKAISRIIQDANPWFKKEVEKLRKKSGKKHNFDGSFLSYYMQELECRVLECVIDFAREQGYLGESGCDACLCFDGTQLEETNLDKPSTDVCHEFNHVVEMETRFRVEWIVKPMDSDLLPQIELIEQERENFVFEYTDELNTSYLNSLPCYMLRKGYFERFAAKILFPQPGFTMMQTHKYRKGTPDEQIRYSVVQYNDHNIRSMLSHCGSGEIGKTEEIPFANKWLKDPDIRVYNRVETEPYPDVFDPARDQTTCLNLFKGYNPHIKTDIGFDRELEPDRYSRERKKWLKPYFDLLKELCEGSEKHTKFLLQVFARKYQKPAEKMGYIFVLRGKQGTGKTMGMDAFGRLFGEEHYYSTDDPDNLFGTHAEGLVGRLVAVMNECEGRHTKDYEGKLKSRSTDLFLTVNAKNVRPYTVQNHAFFIVVSNKQDPVKMDVMSGDRRFIVFKTTDNYLDGKDRRGKTGGFWRQLDAHLKKPLFIRYLSDYLFDMDLEGIDWNRARKEHLTSSYYEMARLHVPIEALFMEHLMSELYDYLEEDDEDNITKIDNEGNEMNIKVIERESTKTVQIKKSALFREYIKWGKKNCFHTYGKPSSKCFYNKLKEMECPLEEIKSNGYPSFKFNLGVVIQHLTDKQWIEASTPQPEDNSVESIVQGILDDIIDEIENKAYFDMSG